MYDFLIHNAIGATIALGTFFTLEYISHPGIEAYTNRLLEIRDNVAQWTLDKVASVILEFNLFTEATKQSTQKGTPCYLSYNPQTTELTRGYDYAYPITTDNLTFIRIDLNKDEYSIPYVWANVHNEDGVSNLAEPSKDPGVNIPFLSATMEYNDDEFDIYSDIKPFCLKGTTLDRSFWRFFMKYRSNILIGEDEDFEVSVFDNTSFKISTYNQDQVLTI